MTWEDLLSNEALSNYVTFVLGLFVAAAVNLVRRTLKKGNVVEIERRSTSSLLELGQRARDRLDIAYEGKPIESFHETQFTLRSRSPKVIEDVEMRLELDPGRRQDLYEISVEDKLGGVGRNQTTVECIVEDGGGHYLDIKTPFLNPHRLYKDEVTIRIYAPLEVTATAVRGGGPEWSAQYVDRVAYNEKLETLVRESSTWTELLFRAVSAGVFRRRRE